MKCFTLTAKYKVIPTIGKTGIGVAHASSRVYREKSPQPQTGIELSGEDGNVALGHNAYVPLSTDLLLSSPDRGLIERNGNKMTLFNASVQLATNGKTLLIPEGPTDKESALLLLDIGVGDYHQVSYELGSVRLVTKFSEGVGMNAADDVLLVILKPFEKIVATRSSKNRIFWGPMVPRETVTISYDGENIFYTATKV